TAVLDGGEPPALRGSVGAAADLGFTWMALLGDARCSASPPANDCDLEDGLDRPPHVLIADETAPTLTVVDLPAACTPRRLDSTRGIGVLRCDDGAVFVLDAHGRW